MDDAHVQYKKSASLRSPGKKGQGLDSSEETGRVVGEQRELSTGSAAALGEPSERRRPARMAWISDELLGRTVEVWSEAYDRPVDEDEAIEILMNVKRLGETLLSARREGNQL